MSNIETGGPAFPTEHTDTSGLFDGMTLRDYFAAKAMTALIEKCAANNPIAEKRTHEVVAILAYMFSDEMMEARK